MNVAWGILRHCKSNVTIYFTPEWGVVKVIWQKEESVIKSLSQLTSLMS